MADRRAPTPAWLSQARLLPALIWTTAGVHVVVAVVCGYLFTQVGQLSADDDPAARMLESWQLLVTATGLVWAITAAVWITWQRGIAWQLELIGSTRRNRLTQSFAWFLPIVQLWWPLGDIRDLHAILAETSPSRTQDFGTRQEREVFEQSGFEAGLDRSGLGQSAPAQSELDEFTNLTKRWWACWLIFLAACLIAAWLVGGAVGASGAQAGFAATAIAGLLCLPAAWFATKVVRHVNSLV